MFRILNRSPNEMVKHISVHPIQIMIAGAQRAGTSSLKNYLGQHPGVSANRRREMDFFVNDQEYALGYERAFSVYFHHSEPKHVLLAKSIGIMYSSEAMTRLRDHNPDIHLIVSLRHPVDRAYSAYWFARRRGWEDIKTFEEALEADPKRFGSHWVRQRECAYVDRSSYVKHLAKLFEHFDRKQVHVFFFGDIKHDIVGICREFYSLFELDPKFVPQVNQRHNTAAMVRSEQLARLLSSNLKLKHLLRRFFPDRVSYSIKRSIIHLNEKTFTPPSMNPETRERLIDYFRPFNDQLSELLGRDLNHWNA